MKKKLFFMTALILVTIALITGCSKNKEQGTSLHNETIIKDKGGDCCKGTSSTATK